MSCFFIAEQAKDEFALQTIEEIKERLSKKELEKMNLKNELLTTYNPKAIILRYRQFLKPFKDKIERLEEFPFKDFFCRVVVNDRNNIEIVLNPFQHNKDLKLKTINTVEIEYKIRQTPHKLISNLTLY